MDFLKKVLSLTDTFNKLGNPFQEESAELCALDTKIIVDHDVASQVNNHFQKGMEKFQHFLSNLPNVLYDTITQNLTGYFKPRKERKVANKQLKDDCQLFSQLFISCQSRDIDLLEFFSYENQPYPASLSEKGGLYRNKIRPLNIDPLLAGIELPDNLPNTDSLILDGSTFTHTHKPGKVKMFSEYVKSDMMRAIEKEILDHHCKHLHMVLDRYMVSSLKSYTRSQREKGVRKKVTGTSFTPKNWDLFLQTLENKTELFNLVADTISELPSNHDITITKNEKALHNQNKDCDALICSHEEADTRMFVHVRHAAIAGSRTVTLKVNDTDILVIQCVP